MSLSWVKNLFDLKSTRPRKTRRHWHKPFAELLEGRTLLTGPTISTTTLPNWTVNQPYDQTIVVTGGTGAITFTDTAGSLPTGLNLNSATGVIAGTPTTTSGSPFNFTITATDATDAAVARPTPSPSTPL